MPSPPTPQHPVLSQPLLGHPPSRHLVTPHAPGGSPRAPAPAGATGRGGPPDPAAPVTQGPPAGGGPAGAGRRPARLLAVTGARGGLGASTLLLHLAWALSREERRVAVIDLDPAGGLGLLLGDDARPGLRWADLPARESAFRPGQLVGALPVWHSVPVLTGDSRGGPAGCAGSPCAGGGAGPGAAPGAGRGAGEAVEPLPSSADAALAALADQHDIVLVDLPRGRSAPVSAQVLLLTGQDLCSAVAAEVLAPRLRERASSVSLVVRSRGEDMSLDDLERVTGCPLLGVVPTDRSAAQRLARGEDPVRSRSPVRRAARALARHLLAQEGCEEPDAGPRGPRRTARPGRRRG